jgi:hypothetical protein
MEKPEAELKELKKLAQAAVDSLGDKDVYDDIRQFVGVEAHDDAMLALYDWLAKH